MGRYVPSEAALQEYERAQLERAETSRMRRETALKREQDRARFIQTAAVRREEEVRKQKEEQGLWASFTEWFNERRIR